MKTEQTEKTEINIYGFDRPSHTVIGSTTFVLPNKSSLAILLLAELNDKDYTPSKIHIRLCDEKTIRVAYTFEYSLISLNRMRWCTQNFSEETFDHVLRYFINCANNNTI